MTIGDVGRQFAELSGDRSERFDEMAATVFAFQRARCAAYSRYCSLDDPHTHTQRPEPPADLTPFFFEAPLLPVEAFKHAAVTTFASHEADVVFESSGTGRGRRSRHLVRDRKIYERAVRTQFVRVFGEGPFVIVAHLPRYADRSSLVYMLHHLIDTFGAEGSGFFLDDHDVLSNAVARSKSDGVQLLIFGAAFGLLELVEKARRPLPDGAIVIETGGMKTHRRETTRSALHIRLADGFGVERRNIRSEYGMCELMSQCYTSGGETFDPPGWMRFTVVDPADPRSIQPEGHPGALAVIDLANLYSCSFLLTGDRAVRRGEGFEVVGRLTGAELRGCNFLIEDA